MIGFRVISKKCFFECRQITVYKWRNQDVDITIKIPEGKAIYLGENMIKIIYDIENASNTWDADMVGKTWEMKADGLTLKEIEE